MDRGSLRQLLCDDGDERVDEHALTTIEGQQEEDKDKIVSTVPIVATEADAPQKLGEFLEQSVGDSTQAKVLWMMEDLFKKNVQGNVRFWRIGCEAVKCNETDARLFVRTEYGMVGGKTTLDRNEVFCNRSGRNLEEQCWVQARQKWREMWRDDGYRFYSSVSETTNADLDSASRPLPAKATLWSAGDIAPEVYPVAAQAKLDGHRMMARMTAGDAVICRTCNNREHTHLSEIKQALVKFFEFLPPGTEIDGEIFTPELTFQQLSSAIRNERKQTAEQRLLKYYIFDVLLNNEAAQSIVRGHGVGSGAGGASSAVPPTLPTVTRSTGAERSYGIPFELRYNLLLRAYLSYQQTYPNEKLVLVLSHLLSNDAQVEESMQRYVEQRFEGVILRKVWLQRSSDLYVGSLYHTDRSRHMYKHKPFRDEEGLVVGVTDAAGREAGAALLQVQTKEGKFFTLRMVGSLERRRQWLQNPATVVGKQVTYRYQDKTDSGLPRFPRGIEIRDYE